MKNYLKKNKPLLLLPLALIPFVVLIFYILGGGSAKQAKDQSKINNDSLKGANYKIPDADRDIRIYDKMEAAQSQNGLSQTHDYNILGEKDSTEQGLLSSAQQTAETTEPTGTTEPEGTKGPSVTAEADSTTTESKIDSREQSDADTPDNLLKHIRKREAQLRKDLAEESTSTNNTVKQNVAAQPNKKENANSEKGGPIVGQTTTPDIQIPTGIMELNRVFAQNERLTKSNDSLSKRLNQAEEQIRKAEEEKQKHFSLEKSVSSGFTNPRKMANPGVVPIKAEVSETEAVLTGNRVKLRLIEDCRLNGVHIPRNTFIYGTCKINNERLEVDINQIPVDENFIPVQISVYDLDGQKGLYVPDNAARKVAKEAGSSVNTSSMFGVNSNPLLYAGIQAADRATQSVVKMIRIKKVIVKKNTLVYLIDKTK